MRSHANMQTAGYSLLAMVMLSLMASLPVAPAHGADAAHANEQPTKPHSEPIELFNGKDLTGLYTWLVDSKREDVGKVFTATDGMIRISGDGLGYLATEKTYADYHLIVEFKWGERNQGERIGKARDSGIFLHASGPDGNSYDGKGAYMAAIECNVMEGAVGDFLLIKGKGAGGKSIPLKVTAHAAAERDADGWPTWREGGKPVTLDGGGRVNWFGKDPRWRDSFGYRGGNDVESEAGKWTIVECICDGRAITTKVNGKLVNKVQDVEPAHGKILLQCEGSEIFIRRFELRPLPRDEGEKK